MVDIFTERSTAAVARRGWSAVLAYEHYWTPQWHQSFTGAYMQVNYDNMLCAFQGQGVGIGSTAVALPAATTNVTKSFYLSVEALYLQQILLRRPPDLFPPPPDWVRRRSAPAKCAGTRTSTPAVHPSYTQELLPGP